ncbi:MAG: alginate lyase family protein [Bacteroidota bacterium]
MNKPIPFSLFTLLLLLMSCQSNQIVSLESVIEFDHESIISEADQYLLQAPVPITQFVAERSEGGIHDFYSEGDYWWPNPEDPDGPYIRRDGESNPDNFTAHREIMWDLGRWVATLVGAYKVTGDEKYAQHALTHLKAWFIDPNTLMNPSLLYAQAIKGRVTGRGIGIIDTIHLIEVARSIQELEKLGFLKGDDLTALKDWFDQFVTWLNTHQYGIDERDHGNNHSTWWAAQVAVFADLTARDDYMKVARAQFKKLLPAQMDSTGGFPEELSRTKPYNYTLFNLEGYSVLARIASTEEENLWAYQGKTGSLSKAFEFMVPFMADKSQWIKAPDVQYFDKLPIQSSGLLFAALGTDNSEWMEVWESLSPERKAKEIERTYPIRQPILWIE